MTERQTELTGAVAALNALPEDALRRQLEACCGSRRWVEEMVERRPFADAAQLYAAAEDAAESLERDDWLEAFSHHPRLGDVEALRQRFGARSGAWSEGEQVGLEAADEEALRRLAAGNRSYEDRFGYLFIVCASGKTAGEMLVLLEARLGNPPDVEIGAAAAEQRKITRLRLEKWLCDAVESETIVG